MTTFSAIPQKTRNEDNRQKTRNDNQQKKQEMRTTENEE